MNRKLATFLGLAVLVAMTLPAPAAAGDEHGKNCTAEATVCVRHMADNLKNRGWIGIEMDDEDPSGLHRITRVFPDSPALAAGFQVGDLLKALNGIDYAKGKEAVYAEAKKSIVPGGKVTFTVVRAGADRDIVVTPGELPGHIMAQWIGQHMMEHHMAPAEEAKVAESKE